MTVNQTEAPASILFGDYRATPEGPLWSDGSCRWRVKGPGVDRLTRHLKQCDAMGEVYRWLQESGMGGVRPAAWVEVPVVRPVVAAPAPSRWRAYPPPNDGPLPAWVVVDESKPYPACIIVGCVKRHNSRRLCVTHDHLARKCGVRDRVGPKAGGGR